MSILLPKGNDWLVSNWISMGFFEDSLSHLSAAPDLAADVKFCVDAEVDTLDLWGKDATQIRELHRLTASVFEDNRISGGRNFQTPEAFPVYLRALAELQDLIKAEVEPALHVGRP